MVAEVKHPLVRLMEDQEFVSNNMTKMLIQTVLFLDSLVLLVATRGCKVLCGDI